MNKDFTEIVKAALTGDEAAFEALYTMTKDSAYFVALSITHNEQDALDILQESYIKAFTHLNELKSPELFDSWLKRIVANRSKNFLKVKKPVLFSDIPENASVNESDEETDSELIPHEFVDKNETSRLLMEVINKLPENMRLVILMYYYQEMSTGEISETLELPLTTVKYYLFEGRKQIKAELEKLDKEGTRLYAVIPFALFPSLIEQAAKNTNAPAFSAVSKAVMSGAGKTSSAVSSPAKLQNKVNGGKNMFLKTTASKIAAAVAAVAVVGGGVTAAVLISNNNNSVPVDNSAVSQKEPVSQTSAEKKKESSQASEVSVDTAKDYEYEFVDNGVVITRYNGKDTEVVIPDTIAGKPVLKIGEISEDENGNNDMGVFQNKPDIVSIDIPDGVTTIGDKTFSYCSKLSELNIANGVTEIGNSAFSGCIALKGITIPDTVTKIGNSAFSGCRAFTDINIPKSITNFGDDVFKNCQKLASVKLENGITAVGNGAFSDCTSLTNIDIPNTVTVIGDTAFSDCTSLANINIPDTVTDIGLESFSNCTALTSITIPDSVEIISDRAFSGCTSLASINILGNYTEVAPTAFDDTQWYDSQPDGVVYAGKAAIKYKGEMPANTSIELKSDTTNISKEAFSNCINLTGITIPNEVVSIGSKAFSDCINLTSITIPNKVVSIGSGLFSGCTALSVIDIPDSVTHIDERFSSGNTFSDTAWYASQPDGVVYVGKVAYKYKGEMPENTRISIKEGTTEINSNFVPLDYIYFNGSYIKEMGKDPCNPNLIGVEIPNSVKRIGRQAFVSCVSLTDVYIPDSVTEIEDMAFDNYYKDIDIDIVIHGKSGSAAETFAKENNIPFVAE